MSDNPRIYIYNNLFWMFAYICVSSCIHCENIIEIFVPDDVKPGYIVLNAFCKVPTNVNYRRDFEGSQERFNEVFYLSKSGEIKTRQSLHNKTGYVVKVPLMIANYCEESPFINSSIIFRIVEPSKALCFKRPQYVGHFTGSIFSWSDSYGIEYIYPYGCNNKHGYETTFVLFGEDADYFDVEHQKDQIKLKYKTQKRPVKTRHNFILFAQSSSGRNGQTTISIKIRKPSSFENGINGIFEFNQQTKLLQRQKRETSAQEFTIPEDKTGNLFRINHNQLEEPTTFYIASSSTDIFEIDDDGGISLRDGEKLDYENESRRTITLKVERRTIPDGSVVTTYQITVRLTDVNDEIPFFTNHLKPYLTTVSPTAAAGTLVYSLTSSDPDQGAVIHCNLESDVADKFAVVTTNDKVCEIQTVDGATFESNKEYMVGVSVSDTAAEITQKSDVVFVHILAGYRPPQFFQPSFETKLPENTPPDESLFVVRAHSFQGRSLRYELLSKNEETAEAIKISEDGVIKVRKALDYEKDPHKMEYEVGVTEAVTGLTSTASLTVLLVDENEHEPVFTLSVYTTTVSEDSEPGKEILTISATDRDIDTVFYFSVQNDLFSVESRDNKGYIAVAGPLDYDRVTSHMYEFLVEVSDNGDPVRIGTASVRVFVTNVNDEYPEFDGNLNLRVSEDAKPGTFIAMLLANDLDGDHVTYSLVDDKKMFSISKNSGRLTLEKLIPGNIDVYTINVVATDDGSCCEGNHQLSNRASVVVNIVDVNNNKPTFPSCDYSPTVEEQIGGGAFVAQVTAIDDDRGVNGDIEYSFLNVTEGELEFFSINAANGVISTAMSLDRESLPRLIYITVVARDKGKTPLENYCSFSVAVGDINDNYPVFDASSYKVSVSRTIQVHQAVFTLQATDQDLGENGTVTYRLIENPEELFYIDDESGIVYVKEILASVSSSVVLIVGAADHGTESKETSVTLTITLETDPLNLPPIWLVDNIAMAYSVEETKSVGSVIATFEADIPTGNRTVVFGIIDGSKSGHILSPFQISHVGNAVTLSIYKALNYNEKKRYSLRIRVTILSDNPLSSDINLIVEVVDKNTEVPQFVGLPPDLSYYTGSVPENVNAGRGVIFVTAVDKDSISPANQVTYSIVEEKDFSHFTINSTNGHIRSTTTFDREEKENYYITVRAVDGAPSDRPDIEPPNHNSGTAVVQIRITDANDNSPSFSDTMYSAKVREDAAIMTSVITIHAFDLDIDDELSYSLESDDASGYVFGIKGSLGEIFVAQTLDYDKEPRVYSLTYRVTDGFFTNSTSVQISLENVNDIPPKFQKEIYKNNDVTEADDSISVTSPFLIETVMATDGDFSSTGKIEYRLAGELTEGPSSPFYINSTTGQIYLTQPLDRDKPFGRAVYEFNVLAIDEPDSEVRLTGFAVVQVMPIDINDNPPVFKKDSLQGGIKEHSASDEYVMSVFTEDYDEDENGRVTYRIISQSPANIVSIDAITGELRTTVDNLDREAVPVYSIEVEALDHGIPPLSASAKVTINILDINDNSPKFEKHIYQVKTTEEQKSGIVTTIFAEDIDENPVLTFKFQEESTNFRIDTKENHGNIIVTTPLDYEMMSSPEIYLSVIVHDQNELHTDTAQVIITIQDINDNAPIYTVSNKEVIKAEDVEVRTELARFIASDSDSGMNGEFDFFIERSTDHHKQFFIEKEGNESIVYVNRPLDRETTAQHNLHILAIDRGRPPLTGTATLTINVEDINDNFPIFAEQSMYSVVVMENEGPKASILKIYAIDLDLPKHGPPFGFSLPCNGVCPCMGNDDTCGLFTLTFDPDGDSGRGSATIGTNVEFDREKKKYYHLPIVTWDMRGTESSLTGSNTILVEIGDVNDNVHKPGSQHITINNYGGLFENIKIGRVYVEDPDDWDVSDKTYTHTGPEYTMEYFRVDKNTGDITLAALVPEGFFEFSVNVYDKHFDVMVTSKVMVTIFMIPAAAVYNSGSVRFAALTPEQFVHHPKTGTGISDYGLSKLDLFQKEIAGYMGLPKRNVYILSVIEHGESLDVHFAAHGSPWYSSNILEGVVNMNFDEFRNKLSEEIAMVSVNDCPSLLCESGCFSEMTVKDTPVVVNTNGTSFVGVNIKHEPKCGCREINYQDPETCTPTYCYNGGRCDPNKWGIVYCECPDNFDGPRCQETRISLDGTGLVQYSNLEQCEYSRTSLEILTSVADDALLLYNGPIRNLLVEEATDFVLLELIGGYPRLRISHGSGELQLQVTGHDKDGEIQMQKLNDGKWHRIDIIREQKFVRLIVDHCVAALKAEGDVQDRTVCESSGFTLGEDMYLDIYTPLQLGGRMTKPDYPKGVSSAQYSGCIKNLRHNSILYDLHTVPIVFPGIADECVSEDGACGEKCQKNGKCEVVTLTNPTVIRCICKPGYHGDMCQYDSSVRDLKTESFLDWRMKDNFHSQLNSFHSDIQLMFRTRDEDGVAFSISSQSPDEFLRLEVIRGILQVSYSLGGGPATLQLPNVSANNGCWHHVQLERYGTELILMMDGGEGRLYADTLGRADGHYKISVQKEQVFAGALVAYYDQPAVESRDLTDTCLSDVHLAMEWFPLTNEENLDSNAAELLNSPNTVSGCIRDDCAGVNCPSTYVCVPLWGIHQCLCPEGTVEDIDSCVPYDYCRDKPCFRSSMCVNDIGPPTGFHCICPQSWEGDLCNIWKYVQEPESPASLSTTVIIVIVLILALFAVAIVIGITWRRRRVKDKESSYVDEPTLDVEMREHLEFYNEEGAEEEDRKSFDLTKLKMLNEGQRSLNNTPKGSMRSLKASFPNVAPPRPSCQDLIRRHLQRVDEQTLVPANDETHVFSTEGKFSDKGSLSSLNTTTSSNVSFSNLNNWGSKFSRVKDIYHK